MGKNKQNKKPAARDVAVNSSAVRSKKEEKRRLSATEIFLIVFGAVALVGIVASIVVGIVANTRADARIDYLNDNLGKYIYVAESDYRDFEVDINLDPVDEVDVESALLQMLAKNKSEEPKYNGIYVKNQTVNPGDVLYIYYRGYTVTEDGKKVDFDGGCNFSGEASELEIGSGSFIPGFELNLVGKNPKNYGTFTKQVSTGVIGGADKVFVSYTRQLNDGTVMAKACKVVDLSLGRETIDTQFGTGFYNNIVGKQYGTALNTFTVETDNGNEKFGDVTVYRATNASDLISITYSAFNFDGTVAQGKTALIDLTDPELDNKFGIGFADFFKSGVPVGTKAVDAAGKAATLNTTVGEKEKNSYFDITVNAVYELGENPLTVEAYFPTDYTNSEELRGVTAYFDVYIMKSQEYDAPELNDKFITETLKLTAEDLKEFEGDTLVEQYRAKVKSELEDAYTEAYNTALDNAILAHYAEKASVKRLPEKDVRDIYDRYYNEIVSQFSYYSSYYESLDAFAREYMELSSNADWQAELRKDAEEMIAQKLAFYYVIREEELIISEESGEYDKRYDDVVAEHLESYLVNVGCVRDKYKTDEEYEEKKAEYKQSMLNYYTDEYFRDAVIYEYALETLRTYVKVK